MMGEFLQEPRVAYFSMEIALRNEIPTYAGGLGVLAGDTLRAAADLRLPLVAVTLVSRAGYFRQEIDENGPQTEHAAPWDPERWARRLDAWCCWILNCRKTTHRTGKSLITFTGAIAHTVSNRRWCWEWGAFGSCIRSASRSARIT